MRAIVATVAFAASTKAQDMNIGCLLGHCGLEFAAAVPDPKFIANSICESGCTKVYDEDTTPEKLHYQNCTTTCAVSHESEAGDKFLACAMDHNCVSFPPIPGNCPYKKEHVQPDSSLASLSGEWWQHRGKNELWDCYPCQHIHSMFQSNDADFCAKTIFPETGPVQAPCWSYSYSYDLYHTDGTTAYFGQTWQLPGNVEAGNPIDIYYNYMGSWHNETWYIFEATDNYVLLGDCSYMMDWVDVGSIVWVRPGHVLSDDENARIKSVYADKLGWEYDDFCYDTHESDECHTAPSFGERIQKPRRAHKTPPGTRRPVLTLEEITTLKGMLSETLV